MLLCNRHGWGTWIRTKEMSDSESDALPLGYTPIIENESSPANRIDLCKKMGRVVGVEPTHNGATIRRVNHFTTPAASCHTAPAV